MGTPLRNVYSLSVFGIAITLLLYHSIHILSHFIISRIRRWRWRSNTIPTRNPHDSGTDNARKDSCFDLPIDILPSIVERLGLIDLLSFRAVCKDWRSAASTASALIESQNDSACLLLYGKGSKCTFFHQKLKKKYTIKMPELEGATCLASNNGWILVFNKGSIFFFCPFSRAKIHLPPIPGLIIIKNHVAAFSAPPTCEECVVSVISRRSSEKLFEINVLTRGANMWSKYEKPAGSLGREITGVSYHNGIFYYCDGNNFSGKLWLKDKKWEIVRLVDITPGSSNEPLPFRRFSGKYYGECGIKKWINKEGFSDPVSNCGTAVTRGDMSIIISSTNTNTNTNSNDGSNSKLSNLKGVWIQPRFFQLDQSQKWSDL